MTLLQWARPAGMTVNGGSHANRFHEDSATDH